MTTDEDYYRERLDKALKQAGLFTYLFNQNLIRALLNNSLYLSSELKHKYHVQAPYPYPGDGVITWNRETYIGDLLDDL